ncbi:glycosyltransferase family 2 protein [Ramlibacter sp. H39-3-26]|uniref:glycosyltransferase family 2 protein n=1 Tax=Curvibacter soli TaxID=3031331 RepID=UPI0023DB6BB5|nr:glycosyltransferase family 2 protein [Ramlibacter sp. H39-3-26]MDF1486078.1 glycosyltransferase family 2 protein [Ramlibacter sp. H39-3-26]
MTSPAPWLSILVPVYNVEAYLAECVESVMQQAGQGVEVILLDDCSTDASWASMQALAARWPGRLRLLRQGRNGGLSAARNALIEDARGDYLWFLDSDDKLLPGAIDAMHAIVERHAPDLVLCDFQVWRAQPRLKHRLRGERHRRTFAGPAGRLGRDRPALLAGMLATGQLHAWSKIARRALWAPGLRFPPGRYFEDMATMPLLALRAASWYYAPSPWVAYRQRGGSILAAMTPQKALDQSGALAEFRRALEQQEDCWRDPTLALALAHQSARNLVGAMRCVAAHPHARASTDAALAERFRQNFRAASPLSPRALERAYLLRGWWLRWYKFRHWFHYLQP